MASEAEAKARSLFKKGGEFVPRGVSDPDHQVSMALEKLWRQKDPPSEQVLAAHRDRR
jgi:hypothetical protein